MKRCLLALAALVALGALASTAAATRLVTVPDPCSTTSNSLLNTAFGASSDTENFGTPGTAKSHGIKAKTCEWTYGNAQIEVTFGPSKYAPAKVTGTVTRIVAGLPPHAHLLVNKRPGNSFTAVTFVKGARFVEVWGNSSITQAHVIKLARGLYAKL
ncbi:MAG TPA: hypothetical protein VFW85_05295 [Gaiellaceae bacterium]|nr:hypothetical protein [Gaiellaceae bacterium]